MKKVYLSLAALAIVFGLTACAKQATDEAAPVTDTPAAEAPAAPVTDTPAAQ